MRALKPGKTGTCQEEITALVQLHTRVLEKTLLKLKGQLQGFRYSNPNFYTFLSGRINNPTKYGTYSHNGLLLVLVS